MISSRPRRSAQIGVALAVAIVLLALLGGLAPVLWPGPLGRDAGEIVGIAVFAASYLALAVGRIPGLAIDRAGVALVGASLMVAGGALPLAEAYRAIDLDTLVLLLGMMIIVAGLRLSGFFALVSGWIVRRAHQPLSLLAAVVAVSGVCSAFLVNDAVCLALTPLVLAVTRSLRRNPVPYLLAVAMAANIGSTATITGNPQNMMIGSLSHIPYGEFAARLTPVAAAGLVLAFALIALLHRDEFAGGGRLAAAIAPERAYPALVSRSLAATAAVIALFFAGMPPAKAAILVAGLLLLTRRVRSERIYAEIDWSLLLIFAGLFVIVAGGEKSLVADNAVAWATRLDLGRVPVLSLVTAVLSNLVSNVPAVLLLKPLIARLPDPRTAWLTAAMASTLAGNLTILGSIANLIVVRLAAAGGVPIGFWTYFRVGAPLTVLTLLVGILSLSL